MNAAPQNNRENLVSGRVPWTDLTPPEWRDRDERAAAQTRTIGTVQPFEKQLFRKDGSRLPVLVGGAIFEEGGKEGVAFVLDLSERKRGEEARRQAQADLAHVGRVTTMGELTASIAHEVNQPLTAIVNNASFCLDLLAKGVANVQELREALAEIIDDADRASAVLMRIRQLAKRAPVEKSLLDLKDVVNDVLALARYESATRRVTIRTELPQDLPLVSADRVQLQQVLLNLVINGMDAMR